MNKLEFEELYDRYLDTSQIKRKYLDIAYSDLSSRNKFDLYLPDEGECFPLIIFIHGGAYIKGDKGRYQLKPALKALTRGYAVASLNYRFVDEACFEEIVVDVLNAIDFIEKHCRDLCIDIKRIVLWGESAGATLALHASLRYKDKRLQFKNDIHIRAVIDWYGTFDYSLNHEASFAGSLLIDCHKTLLEKLFQTSKERLVYRLQENSLKPFIKETKTSYFIQHGTDDTIVNIKQSEQLYKYLTENNKDCIFHRIQGATHCVDDFSNDDNLENIFNFLDKIKKTL